MARWIWEIGTALVKVLGGLLAVSVLVAGGLTVGAAIGGRPLLGFATLTWLWMTCSLLVFTLAVHLPTRPGARYDIWKPHPDDK